MRREVFARVCAHPPSAMGPGEADAVPWGCGLCGPPGALLEAGWSEGTGCDPRPPKLPALARVLSPARGQELEPRSVSPADGPSSPLGMYPREQGVHPGHSTGCMFAPGCEMYATRL